MQIDIQINFKKFIHATLPAMRAKMQAGTKEHTRGTAQKTKYTCARKYMSTAACLRNGCTNANIKSFLYLRSEVTNNIAKYIPLIHYDEELFK